MAEIKVKKGNKMLRVDSREKELYKSRGFNVLAADGTIAEYSSTDDKSTIERLTNELEAAKAAHDELVEKAAAAEKVAADLAAELKKSQADLKKLQNPRENN